MKTVRSVIILVIGAYLTLPLCGCGYSTRPQSALPGQAIALGLIENRTLEPKLQDKLSRALTEEFAKRGVRVGRGADYTLTGVVNGFDMVSLSEKGGITVEYRVTVSAEFRLLDPGGKVVMAKNFSSPFIVSLTDQGDLGGLLALKDLAEERAMSDLAIEITGAVIFR
jgi:outer membrane lipopolysaccharide assembly protein LptE/RlpB